ncbi:unnamed protein product, partial [Adineta ricciae]
HILYIHNPATYGFSGGLCFLPKDNDEWEFTGLLTGASRLWNKCVLLQQSTAFNYYYNNLIQCEEKQKDQQEKIEF